MLERSLKKFFSIENRTKFFLKFLIFLTILAAIVFIILVLNKETVQSKPSVASKKFVNPFSDLTLEAKAAIVWDTVENRQIFAKNAGKPLPLASLTKVMTALTAEKIVGNSNIVIQPQYLESEGDSHLIIGDIWKSRNLSDFTLLTSSNDGAVALAAAANLQLENKVPPDQNNDADFIKQMNETAKKIGLEDSKFLNEHGLDTEADKGGAYGSAKDMALLFQYILKNNPEILEATRYDSLYIKSLDSTYLAQNTNYYLNKIPGILASKTGYTELAGGNLVIAYDAGLNRPIIVVVLGSSQEGRFSDTLKLVEASQKYVQTR